MRDACLIRRDRLHDRSQVTDDRFRMPVLYASVNSVDCFFQHLFNSLGQL